MRGGLQVTGLRLASPWWVQLTGILVAGKTAPLIIDLVKYTIENAEQMGSTVTRFRLGRRRTITQLDQALIEQLDVKVARKQTEMRVEQELEKLARSRPIAAAPKLHIAPLTAAPPDPDNAAS